MGLRALRVSWWWQMLREDLSSDRLPVERGWRSTLGVYARRVVVLVVWMGLSLLISMAMLVVAAVLMSLT